MRICIAEANPIVAGTLREFLSTLGHQVAVFRSVSRLLDVPLPDDAVFDLLLVSLPDSADAGAILLRALHMCLPDADIIATTNKGNGVDTGEAARTGVFAFLHRPIRLAELELMLIRLEERRMALEACLLRADQVSPLRSWAEREFVRPEGAGSAPVSPVFPTGKLAAQMP